MKIINESQFNIIYPFYEDESINHQIIETLGYDINQILNKSYKQITSIYTLGKYPFSKFTFICLGKKNERRISILYR
jgi:hypothetical protein